MNTSWICIRLLDELLSFVFFHICVTIWIIRVKDKFKFRGGWDAFGNAALVNGKMGQHPNTKHGCLAILAFTFLLTQRAPNLHRSTASRPRTGGRTLPASACPWRWPWQRRCLGGVDSCGTCTAGASSTSSKYINQGQLLQYWVRASPVQENELSYSI